MEEGRDGEERVDDDNGGPAALVSGHDVQDFGLPVGEGVDAEVDEGE